MKRATSETRWLRDFAMYGDIEFNTSREKLLKYAETFEDMREQVADLKARLKAVRQAVADHSPMLRISLRSEFGLKLKSWRKGGK